jgi:hypothetical protein
MQEERAGVLIRLALSCVRSSVLRRLFVFFGLSVILTERIEVRGFSERLLLLFLVFELVFVVCCVFLRVLC